MADKQEVLINVTDLERIRDLRAELFAGWSTAQIVEELLNSFEKYRGVPLPGELPKVDSKGRTDGDGER
jgi:hypothetical protein